MVSMLLFYRMILAKKAATFRDHALERDVVVDDVGGAARARGGRRAVPRLLHLLGVDPFSEGPLRPYLAAGGSPAATLTPLLLGEESNLPSLMMKMPSSLMTVWQAQI